LYVGTTSLPAGHASKVSYNRPFITRLGGGGGGVAQDWLFNAEYPMIRFLERNGYDLSYTTNVDAARAGNLILNHKAFLSVGHDEYWSAAQRTNVEAARNAGVHLAFFSGNEISFQPSQVGEMVSKLDQAVGFNAALRGVEHLCQYKLRLSSASKDRFMSTG